MTLYIMKVEEDATLLSKWWGMKKDTADNEIQDTQRNDKIDWKNMNSDWSVFIRVESV
jgi:isochorismate hydrolase